MKIVELNAVPYGATGRIAKQISAFAIEHGHESVFVCSWSKHKKKPADANEWVMPSFFSRATHMGLSTLFGGDGFHSRHATKKFLKKLDEYKPDILHLHIMHSYFFNVPLLFDYVKKHDIKVVWTFHDCWALTAQCPHFVSINCEKWQTGCSRCPMQKQYSLFPTDSAERSYRALKESISGVKSMTLVPCSEWAAGFISRSMFQSYPVRVINNGIDRNVFHPTPSDFREKYHCEDKIVVLGVAFQWLYRKGLDVFQELAEKLPPDYAIVMVGTDEKTDSQLPERIISIHRTKDPYELAAIYSAADMFVNPTREDTYPTVNIESLACGTPVITFRTGGSPEIIDESCGAVVECGDTEGLYREILRVGTERPYPESACLKRAENFDLNEKYAEYLDLFQSL